MNSKSVEMSLGMGKHGQNTGKYTGMQHILAPKMQQGCFSKEQVNQVAGF